MGLIGNFSVKEPLLALCGASDKASRAEAIGWASRDVGAAVAHSRFVLGAIRLADLRLGWVAFRRVAGH